VPISLPGKNKEVISLSIFYFLKQKPVTPKNLNRSSVKYKPACDAFFITPSTVL
jgi:hypothetical protein